MTKKSDDYIDLKTRKMLNGIPETWSKNEKAKKIKIITDRRDAAWVCSRIFEDVDRGLITVTMEVKKSKRSVEMEILLKGGEIVGTAVLTTAMLLLLQEIKTHLISKWKKKNRRRRIDKDFDDFY